MWQFTSSIRRGFLTLCLGLLLGTTLRAQDKIEDSDETLLQEAGLKTDSESLLRFLRDRSPENAEAVVARFIKALGSDNFREREAAPDALVRLGKLALEPLRKAVKSEDPEIPPARSRPLKNWSVSWTSLCRSPRSVCLSNAA